MHVFTMNGKMFLVDAGKRSLQWEGAYQISATPECKVNLLGADAEDNGFG